MLTTKETPTYQQEKKAPKPKFLYTLMSWFLVIALLMFLASLVVSTFFGDKINKVIMEELNKQFKTDIEVDKFDLNIWNAFPEVSAELLKVKIPDTRGGFFLEAKTISFRFGLMGLFKSHVDIKKVVAQDGALTIHLDEKGNGNYNIFKENKSKSTSSNEFSLNVQEAILQDFEFIYSNKSKKQTSRMWIDMASFSGDFEAKRFSLKSIANLKSDFFELDGKQFIKGQAIQYDALLDVDLKKRIYDFQKMNFFIDDNGFELMGDLSMDSKTTNYNLELKSEKGSLQSVLAFLPEEYQENFKDISSTGTFLFDMTIKGVQSDRENPDIDAKVKLRDGKITSSLLDVPIKDVSFTSTFSNGRSNNNKSSFIEINKFKGYFNKELTEVDMKLKDFNDPHLTLSLDGVIPIEQIRKFLKNDQIIDGSGELEFHDFEIDGDLNDMRSSKYISKVKAEGRVVFDDASLTYKEETIVVDRGELIIKGNKIQAKKVKVEGFGSNFKFNAAVENLIPILASAEKESDNIDLLFNANVIADKLDVKRIVELFNGSDESEPNEKQAWDNSFSDFLNGSINIDIAELSYGKLYGEDFEGAIDFESSELTLSGDVETMRGDMGMEGRIYLEKKPRLKANLNCEGIDIKQFFNQANNFGQDVLTHRNLKGTLNSNISIGAFWDEEGTFLQEKLKVLASVNVKDGELIKFKLLEDFADYIKIQDLKRIKFTELQNWIEVRNEEIRIPVMFIQSNAANLTVSGSHSFDHYLRYNIKLNATQVLWNRLKKHDRSLKPQKAENKGFNLHYAIRGPLDNYKFRKDRKEVLKQFKLSDLHKKRIKKALKKEFDGKVVQQSKNTEEWEEKVDKKEEQEIEKSIQAEKAEIIKEVKAIEKVEKQEAPIEIPEYDEGAVGEEIEFVWDKKKKKG